MFSSSLPSEIWNLQDYCQQKQRKHLAKGHKSVVKIPRNPANKLQNIFKQRKTIYENCNISLAMVKFSSSSIRSNLSPKHLLKEYAERANIPQPVYKTEREGRNWYSIVEIMGKKYSSLLWESTGDKAEENSALACMYELKLAEQEYFEKNAQFLSIPPTD